MAKVTYLTSKKLSDIGVTHGWFTRAGGVSQVPFDSLNIKKGFADIDSNIDQNRRLALQALDLDVKKLVFIRHEHGSEILHANSSMLANDEVADGVIANGPDFVLGQGTADCGSIVIADQAQTVVGLLHTGWRSAAAGIIPKMIEELGVPPSNLVAGIGPMICGKCYEFGEEAYEHFDKKYIIKGDKQTLDLKAFVVDELSRAGVAQIDNLNVCTFEDERFFSHRRDADEQGQSGRFFTVTALKK